MAAASASDDIRLMLSEGHPSLLVVPQPLLHCQMHIHHGPTACEYCRRGLD